MLEKEQSHKKKASFRQGYRGKGKKRATCRQETRRVQNKKKTKGAWSPKKWSVQKAESWEQGKREKKKQEKRTRDHLRSSFSKKMGRIEGGSGEKNRHLQGKKESTEATSCLYEGNRNVRQPKYKRV